MDYNLPDGTGIEATDVILAEQPFCSIVFLTVQDVDESLFAALRRGARGYLLKNMPIGVAGSKIDRARRACHDTRHDLACPGRIRQQPGISE
jgi:DNA-binding NarL/FixJ family response regulator